MTIKLYARSKKTQRHLRVGELLRHVISDLLRFKSFYHPDLRNMNVTVTEVQMSPDLNHATIFILPLGGQNQQTVLSALKQAVPFLRKNLAQQINLRYTPNLLFKNDLTFDTAHRIDTLLKQVQINSSDKTSKDRQCTDGYV